MKDKYVINNIINHLSAVKANKTKSTGICLLLGAGADITSGGKTFRSLKRDFLIANGYDIPSDIADEKLTEYFDICVDKFSDSGRCMELESIMRKNSNPSEGYKLIVLLAELGYIDAVITTNFDLLLEETQNQLCMRTFDVYAPGVAIPNNFYDRCQKHNPIYIKLHGDLYGRYVSHLTKREIQTKKYGNEYVQMLSYILQHYAIICVGYGGYDELIVEIFKDNLATLSDIYWCDIKEPNESAPLVKLLCEQKILNYVNCSFDELFCQLAGNILKDIEFPDTNPNFIPSIVNSKFEEIRKKYTRHKQVKIEISRDNLIREFEQFLTCTDTSLIFVHGKNGMGKTTLMLQLMNYYNELSFVPLHIDSQDRTSILDYMAKSLGFKTDVPFALLYNFAKWCKQDDKSFVFIIDEVNILKNKKHNIKYIKEICDYLTVIKEYSCIKIILCMDTESYNELDAELTNTLYKKQLNNEIEVTKFFESEIMKILEQQNLRNQDEDFVELLCEPYIWGMVTNDRFDVETSLDECVERYILNNISEKDCSPLNKNNLSIILEKIAKISLGDENNSEVSTEIIDFLNKIGIVDENGFFVYDKLIEYYFYKSLKRKRYMKHIQISTIESWNLASKIKRSAYAHMLSDINNSEELKAVLNFFADLLEHCESEYVKILVFESLQRIQQHNFCILENYILNADVDTSNIINLLDIVCFTSAFASNDPYKLLNKIGLYEKNAYDSFIVKHEYLKTCLNECIKTKKYNTYTEILNTRMHHQNARLNLCDFLYSLTQWGPDIISDIDYKFLINEFRVMIDNPNIALVSDNAYEAVADKVKKYSYNILFNSGIDIEEKFHHTIHDTDLHHICKKVINGEVINETDYLQLVYKSIDINNAWTFLVCNFITVISMYNNFYATYEMLKYIPHKFERVDLVKQLDFYLSSVFMALYITNNNVFENFNMIFSKTVELYERNLFELPNDRLSTIHRFNDEFEKNFEDGFNPLAFYFYVSPSECYLNHKLWNKGNDYLRIYWNLAKKLEETGNYKEMLRIVHALGQMISIYPKEGFEALENMTVYSHGIIKRGVLRILKENYLRYPSESKAFIKNTKSDISSEELVSIKSNRVSCWENRTFEQLHWTRMLVNLSKICNKNIVLIFLKKIISSQSYKEFMIDMLKEIFDIG